MNVHVDEAVGLLEAAAPEALAALRLKYPNHRGRLDVGIVGGDIGEEELNLTRMLADVCSVGLLEAARTCDRAIPQAKAALGRSLQLQLASQLAAAVGSGAVLGTVASAGSQAAIYGGAALALVGSVTSLISQFVGRGFTGQGSGVEQLLFSLVESRPRAKQIAEFLHAWSSSGASSRLEEVEAQINEGNDLCARVYAAWRKL